MDHIQDKLKEAGMRSSHQRIGILTFLRGSNGHPSAREVYESLIVEMPTLSRMTVYNTLAALAEKHLVGVVRTPDGTSRYEYKKEDHCHFFCLACGKVIDVDFACSHCDSLTLEGYEVHFHQGCFEGVCKECRVKEPKPTNGKVTFPAAENHVSKSTSRSAKRIRHDRG